jgi:hypothetical protein
MLRVGQELRSFCSGYFGEDFYEGRVEAVGFDWIVARNRQGSPCMAHFPGGIESHSGLIESWLQETIEAEAPF